MPDSETESKHFFRIFGTFSKKSFQASTFVSIVGLAEAVPAGLQGPLRLVAPRDPPAGCSRQRRGALVAWDRTVPERPFLMVGRRQGVTWAAEGQWFRPSRFGFNGLNTPTDF